MAADAAGYRAGNDFDQAAVQRGLLEVMDGAASAVGVRRLEWQRQPAGDGEFAVLPPEESEPLVVDPFIRELDAQLRRYNLPRQPWARLRLRMAVHFGRLSPADNGFAGPAPIVATSLVNSQVLRQALRDAPEANLALLLSPQVFDDTVATLATTLRPEQFRQVRISEPKFTSEAWLMVPGADVHTLPVDHPEPAGEARYTQTNTASGGTVFANQGGPQTIHTRDR
jgi:hypothetical protein